MSYHIISRYIILYHIISWPHHIILYHITSYYFMLLYFIKSYYIMLYSLVEVQLHVIFSYPIPRIIHFLKILFSFYLQLLR